MKPVLLAVAVLAAFVSATPMAKACTPVIATDPVTGETYQSGSAEWRRREQAGWRAQSATVLIAQARAGRMLTGDQIEFTLVPITSVYGGALSESDLRLRWSPGNTCNGFALTLADLVIAYVDADGALVGVTVPEQLQDRPPGFAQRLREIARGMIGPGFVHPDS